MTPFRTEETFYSLDFVILDDVFKYRGAAKVIPPGVHTGCLLGTLAQGRQQIDKSGVAREDLVYLGSENVSLRHSYI